LERFASATSVNSLSANQRAGDVRAIVASLSATRRGTWLLDLLMF